jgi:hypothetical protein
LGKQPFPSRHQLVEPEQVGNQHEDGGGKIHSNHAHKQGWRRSSAVASRLFKELFTAMRRKP